MYIIKNVAQEQSKAAHPSNSMGADDKKPKHMMNMLGHIFCNEKLFREVVDPAIKSNAKMVSIEGVELFDVLLEKMEIILLKLDVWSVRQ